MSLLYTSVLRILIHCIVAGSRAKGKGRELPVEGEEVQEVVAQSREAMQTAASVGASEDQGHAYEYGKRIGTSVGSSAPPSSKRSRES